MTAYAIFKSWLPLKVGMVKCQMNQIAALIKVSFLEATHREPVRSVVEVHVGIAAVEVEVVGVGATNRTAPIEAVGTHNVERTKAAVAVASQGQFQRGSKGTGAVILAPACAFGI